ncbi:efflux RND transporter periplasmic adaptor subunit [Streptococcus iniae]|uniref:efflux RND transporter periplasmic adaptor subunit n=1 Tax=Streptococcus iniae TaxID=1346 RepID=UPI000EFD177D|nr:efflux RND transporter periplasmic adaptor subunit [Streptococcus iniae]RMI76793.1 efflux transporter periplasmic adaptor subunit [Streptococcus iniae]
MSRVKKIKSGKMTKKTKNIIAGLAVGSVVLIGGFLWYQEKQSMKEMSAKEPYAAVNVTEGTISSSTLLSGTVKALSEEYVYFDQSKGTNASVTVKVGDKVTKGQQLVQYNTTAPQAAYDTAVRNLNKVGRQINYLKTYGVPMATTETSTDEETGKTTSTTVHPTQQQNAGYKQQLQDLNDAYADAQSEVNKAQQTLNETVIVSSVDGTVVEVNNDIDPSSKTSQTLVHVTSEGQLQVKGSLTEFDLATVKAEQPIKIKSKVHPDKEWAGKISYISNYPKEGSAPAGDQSQASSGGSSSASYDYKADITSPLDDLKQGFSVSVEVINEGKHLLIPVTSVVKEGKKNYVWTYNDSTAKVSKTEVTVGSADAKNQEVISGLKVGQIVISNPDKSFTDGKKLEGVTSADTKAKKDAKR